MHGYQEEFLTQVTNAGNIFHVRIDRIIELEGILEVHLVQTLRFTKEEQTQVQETACSSLQCQ